MTLANVLSVEPPEDMMEETFWMTTACRVGGTATVFSAFDPFCKVPSFKTKKQEGEVRRQQAWETGTHRNGRRHRPWEPAASTAHTSRQKKLAGVSV